MYKLNEYGKKKKKAVNNAIYIGEYKLIIYWLYLTEFKKEK